MKRLLSSSFYAVFVIAWSTLTASPTLSQPVTLPLSTKAKLAGVEVTFPLELTLTPQPQGGPLPFVVRSDIAELIAKINEIIRGAGLHQPPGHYQSFNYNGTLLAVQGERLWAKYHFRIDPHNAKPTNGSVELRFQPVVEANALRLVAQDANLNISNDIARAVVNGFGLDRRLEKEGIGEINRVLGSPEARLQLPPELTNAAVTLRSARFTTAGTKQMLEVQGMLDLSPTLIAQLVARLLAR